METKITFIVPTIGRIELKRAIDSLKNQTNVNWRAIIIFDGIEPTIVEEDSRITIIQIEKVGSFSKHHGMSGLVRNHGLEHVKTEWIGFLDDDDTLHENYVENFYNTIKNNQNLGLILWKMVLPNGMVIPRDKNLVFGNVGISFSFKRELVGDKIFNNNRDGEDYDLFKELMGKTEFTISDNIMYFVNK